MEQNEKTVSDNKSTNYEPPSISTTRILMEQSIAAGSAVITPTDSDNVVQEEWTILPDVNTTIDW